MLLADAINLPFVLVAGLVVFGPLTLLVATIETLVMRLRLKVRMRTFFWPVVAANVLSTFAGVLVLIVQEWLVSLTGIRASIPAFVHGYRWVALAVIGCYFAVSVLVEGLWLIRAKIRTKVGRPAQRILGAVVLANVCSYLVTGPLFYVSSRPYFGGLDTTFDTRWSANADVPLYYVDADDGTVRRMQMDGSGAGVLVPRPVTSFLVNADESVVVYADPNDEVHAYWPDTQRDILVRYGGSARAVSVANDGRFAVLEAAGDTCWSDVPNTLPTLRIVDPNVPGKSIASGVLPDGLSLWATVWSHDGTQVYVLAASQSPEEHKWDEPKPHWLVCAATAPALVLQSIDTPPALDALVENYCCDTEELRDWIDKWYLPREVSGAAGTYTVRFTPYLGDALSVQQDGREVVCVKNAEGFLNMNLPRAWPTVFLPHGDEMILGWGGGRLHVLDIDGRRIGLLTDCRRFAARTNDFRVSLGEQPETTADGGDVEVLK